MECNMFELRVVRTNSWTAFKAFRHEERVVHKEKLDDDTGGSSRHLLVAVEHAVYEVTTSNGPLLPGG